MAEKLTIVTPQFERPKGWPAPASPPADRAAFDALSTLDRTALLELGLCPWADATAEGEDAEGGGVATRTLWLFPSEWYHAIPNGFPIVNIFFARTTFERGVTDDDIRFGALAFGIIGALNAKTP